MVSFQRLARQRWRTALGTGVIIVGVVTSEMYWRANDQTAQWQQIANSLAANRRDEAEALLNRWTRRFPDDGNAWVQLGRVLSEVHREEEALAAFRQVEELDKAWGMAQTWIGQVARQAGNLPAAEQAFWLAAQREPRAIEPRIGLVMLFTVQQRSTLTRGILWELYRLTHDVHHLAALTSLKIFGFDDVDALEPLLNNFLRKSPRDAWLRRAQGIILLRKGHPVDALPYLESVMVLRGDAPGRLALAQCHIALEHVVEATTLLGSEPITSEFQGQRWVLMAQMAELCQQDDQVLGYLQQAVTADSENGVAQYRLGQALIRKGQQNTAQVHINQSAAISRRQRHLRMLLSQIGPQHANDTVMYETIAKLCLESGMAPEARAWYEETIRIDPTRMTAQSALSRLTGVSAPQPLSALLPERPLLTTTPVVTTLAIESRRSTSLGQPGLRFDEIAARAGLVFRHISGSTTDFFIADTMGGGVGLIDYDRDGWLDVYLVNGCSLPVNEQAPPAPNKLYHNLRNGMFEDVTNRAGVPGHGYGMGCTVGDFDDDGYEDLFVTGFRHTLLYHNRGDGTFEDVTKKAGVSSSRWCTAAGFADLDGDHDLDLVVVAYVDADPNHPIPCKDPTGRRIHCTPGYYHAQSNYLFRNNGDGTFADIAKETGLTTMVAPGLGLAIADFDSDGLLDIFMANDAVPNSLFRNLGNLRFEEIGVIAGLAYDGEGHATASMGVVADDLDGDGLMDIFHTNLVNEGSTLARNLGRGRFVDVTEHIGLLAPSRSVTGFGTVALDADNDGRLDLFAANGHVDDMPWQNRPMAELPHFYRSVARGRFELADGSTTGAYFTRPVVGRGAAVGDIDNDGRLDIVVVQRDGPVALLHNVSNAGHSLGLQLRGKASAFTPVGTRVTCRVGGNTMVRWITAGTGYLSAHDPRLWFGLGPASSVDRLEIHWPSGAEQSWSGVVGDRILEIVESESPVERMSLQHRLMRE